MQIHAILFDGPALHALEGVSEDFSDLLSDLILCLEHSFGLDVSPSPEFRSARLADSDGILGVVVGEFQDGTPAFLTLERDLDLVRSHSSVLH
jgi:hypothetical protein